MQSAMAPLTATTQRICQTLLPCLGNRSRSTARCSVTLTGRTRRIRGRSDASLPSGDEALVEQPDDVLDRPHVIGQAGLHRWRDAQRLVNAREVVVHEVQGHGGGVVLELLTENAFVSRVNRRIDMRIVRFWRST